MHRQTVIIPYLVIPSRLSLLNILAGKPLQNNTYESVFDNFHRMLFAAIGAKT